MLHDCFNVEQQYFCSQCQVNNNSKRVQQLFFTPIVIFGHVLMGQSKKLKSKNSDSDVILETSKFR